MTKFKNSNATFLDDFQTLCARRLFKRLGKHEMLKKTKRLEKLEILEKIKRIKKLENLENLERPKRIKLSQKYKIILKDKDIKNEV